MSSVQVLGSKPSCWYLWNRESLPTVFRSALCSLQKVEDKCSASFKLTKGLYLLGIGEILWRNKADNERALVSLKLALTFSEPLLKEHTDIARCYNAIGNSFLSLNQLRKALDFLWKSLQATREIIIWILLWHANVLESDWNCIWRPWRLWKGKELLQRGTESSEGT